MRYQNLKATLKAALQLASLLLVGAVAAFGQQTINLTAAPTTVTMPNGATVPMWGYFCGAPLATSTATCARLNPNAPAAPAWTANTVYALNALVLDSNGNVQKATAAGTSGAAAPTWSTVAATPTPDGATLVWTFQGTLTSFVATISGWTPPIITVPYVPAGTSLTINLTNSLSFTPTGGGSPNTVPTSLTIVGQIGGGLGTTGPTCLDSNNVAHGVTCTTSPDHSNLTSNSVTWSTVGVAPGFVPPPQGPRVQSFATEVAAGATTSLTWSDLRPGTYLMESGTHPSIQGPMGLYGILVVTTLPVGATAGTAYPANFNLGVSNPAVTYNAELPLILSEIDPAQNKAVQTAVSTTGFSETMVWSGQPGGCGNASSATYNQCYPPAVNYTPLYYLINGVAFDKTNPKGSLFSVTPASGVTAGTGTVLARIVNAGVHMHVPSIIGSQTTHLAGTGQTAPPAAIQGFQIVAEDGNPLPGTPHVQNEVFMAAGKVYDVMFNAPAAASPALPIYDRELSLSGNATSRDAGMLAYIGVNGEALPSTGVFANTTPVARNDNYPSVVAGVTFAVSDPGKGVIANDTNVYGVTVLTPPTKGTLTLNANGTFTYVPNAGWNGGDSFVYCANGTVTGTGVTAVCSSHIMATATLGAATVEAASGITLQPLTFNANMATYLAVKTPGVLTGAVDAAGYPLTVVTTAGSFSATGGATVVPDVNGGFTASAPAAGSYSFSYTAQNSQGTLAHQTVTLIFPTPSNLQVSVVDGSDKVTLIKDYRWVIEEDRTFYIDPKCTTNPPAAGCPTAGNGIVPTLGVNFHTSYMPFVAQGCTGPLSCEGGQTLIQPNGQHVTAVCDVGNGVCRPDPAGNGFTAVLPGQVHLDPTKRYYISVLPGDAANPFQSIVSGAPSAYAGPPICTSSGGVSVSTPTCGHGMGGAPIPVGTIKVTILSQPSPYPTAKLSVFVFEDDFPLNGEYDIGGGAGGVNTNNEHGLGQFQIHLWDAFGGNGDFTGQMTYDMFNQPLTNGLAGTIDPLSGQDACPISANPRNAADPTSTGITGMIVTCPTFEKDGITPSPLAGQALVENLMPGRWGVIATPGADRIARGEEWLQTNTLDGQKAHDSFTRIGEPSFFQEFGPAGYHVSVGFANPAIINSRRTGPNGVCSGNDPNLPGVANCVNTVTGRVVGERLSRSPDERLYGSGSHDAFAWTQCFASFGDPDGEDFAFTKCDADGNFTFTGLPDGDWRITTFDQWNDQLVDGLSTPIRLDHTVANTGKIGDIASTQWQANLYTRTFIDDNKDGASQSTEAGIPFANVAVRLRDGSIENLLGTDFTGTANFNETFPLFAWYTVETDTTRYKNTGTHVVYDVGGPADGSPSCGVTGYPPCGTSVIGKHLANTAEVVSVPANLRVPGAVYCANADCTGYSILNGPGTSANASACTTSTPAPPAPPITSCSNILSSGRIDPPWVGIEGWQGFPGQNNFIEFGKEPYVAGENGGIKGHVIYASTRPFDDPQMLVQTQWEPLVPHVTINLYQEGFGPDGVTPTRKLVDTTQTSSFDDWAQGFHADSHGNIIPNMSCPGQGASTGAIPDLFYFSLFNQPDYLDWYNSQHAAGTLHPLPNNSQFKCYDGMHNWNQIQPAPYDGVYKFPSVTATDPTTGKPTATNCTICAPNHAVASTDLYYGLPMLPVGKYVVEVVVPPGFELVKEEDKNILIGDNYIAPVTQQFGGLGNVFIIPDQASVATGYPGPGYNANNAQNPTQSFGAGQQNGIVPGFVPEPVWPCVGESRVVPDYISLYPQTHQVAPFAGATRNLCDRKEVTVNDQMGAIAKFYIYTSAHIAAKFTGGITDDYTSEFDPFSPQFGEKFAPPVLPVSIKDWTGNEVSRVYADQWGSYDGMTYSTWEVNPPNPTGYAPTVMVGCMNDPGPIPGPNGTLIQDPQFTEGYSQFCYELPFMPGTTQYLDTPVVPTSAFAGAGYNNVDCAYPDATPAISEVDGDGVGPWVSAAGNTLTINSLGVQTVPNYAYGGPSAKTAPYNLKTITRNYGFGTTQGTVTIGGVTAAIQSWGDAQIKVTVPSVGSPNGVPQCPIQQQAQYSNNASTAYCGELVITRGDNHRQSVDAVNVTIGGNAPTHILASASIQAAIDQAAPGDLLMVDPTCNSATGAVACTAGGVTSKTAAAHNELLIMWKPVRLQGVGAASSIVNANTQPAGKMDVWRQYVNCLFGLALNGAPISSGPTSSNANANLYDPTGAVSCPGNGWNFFNGFDESSTTSFNPQVDRLPLEATVGWVADLNGNLAELLQEPSLMGALEGAGITVLGKGANFPSDPFDASLLAGFPTNSTLLSGPVSASGTFAVGDSNPNCHTSSNNTTNPFPSDYTCNPSSIDALTITDSSQGGGGIFVHGWAHYLQIANNRIYGNAGTLAGGINLGQGEYPPAYLQGNALNAAPGSCETSATANVVLPYCFELNVNIHHNNVSLNSSIGDELFSATPAGAGGVSLCTGSDYYQFNYNWVCGNLSSGDGGGVGHIGFSYNGDIEHNSILFNQSLNPTIATNGGGMIVMGAPDADPVCSTINPNLDIDCVPTPAGSVGPSDGTGPGLMINANLIMGNAAESGSGGGIAFNAVNGSDVVSFPGQASVWNDVTVQNNIIADNVAGWDGAGISLLDSINVNIVNNTIASNASTATSGMLFTTIGAPLASQPGSNCTNGAASASCPQIGGLVTIQHSAVFAANISSLTVVCPPGHFAPGTNPSNGTCKKVSYPQLGNDIFWQNSSYYVGIGALSPQFQQNVVTMYNSFTTTAAPSQPQVDATTAQGAGSMITGGTGACVAANYWDVGVRGDTGPTNHNGGTTLAPTYSLLTNLNGYSSSSLHNVTGNPNFVSQYCNGSRNPPESGASGWQVPPGISDATVPNPVFNLTPVATVDEGNNWINLRWGPLSMLNPVTNTVLGNYAPAWSSSSNSAAIGYIPTSVAHPTMDFFNNVRPDAANPIMFDAGAVEVTCTSTTCQTVAVLVTGGPVNFGNVTVGTTSTASTLTLHNNGNVTITGIAVVVTAPFSQPAGAAGGTCGTSLGAGLTCTINVVFSPAAGAVGSANGSVTITASNAGVSGSPVTLSGNGVAVVTAGGISLVQQNAAPGSFTTSVPVAFPGASTAGNLIVVFVRMSHSSNSVLLPTITDTLHNSYSLALSRIQTTDGHEVALFYAVSSASGANTVTATFPASNNHPYVAINEYIGVRTTNPLDRTMSAQGSSNSPNSGSTATTTNANELVVAGMGLPSSYTGTEALGAGFSNLQMNNSGSAAADESMIVSAIGTYNGTFALGSSANWSALVATFIGASSVTSPTVTTTSLANATQNVAYNTTLTATGGTAPYSWSVTLGALPAGLSLNSATGAISGAPTGLGTSNFTVQVSDAHALTGSASLSLTVVVPPLTVSTTSLPNGEQNAPYNTALAATGGTQPYTAWSITVGSLPAGLTLNPVTGVISGAPTVTGTFNFTVQVTDSASVTAIKALSITVLVPPSITTTSLPNAEQNVAYSTAVAATSGTPAYTWSISVGSLPTGLAINAVTGAITGTPTVPGTINFTVQVTDSASGTATKALSITVVGPPSVTTVSLPNAAQNAAYNTALAATGGITPYTWSIVGSLPTGLTLNTTSGAITGTPTVTGTVNFTVQVSDVNSQTGIKAVSISVFVPPSITTTSLPNAEQNVAYSTAVAATSGTPAYTWSISVGSLPTGLTLNAATGAITGTPTVTGTINFTAQVSDANLLTATKALSIAVVGPPSVTTASLPNAEQNVAYNTALAATGGVPPYTTWSVSVGSLPAGLTLNAVTGAITGMPTVPGTINFTVQVTDSASGTATKALSITVVGPPSVTTASLPNAAQNAAYNTALAATGGITPYTWSITVGGLPAGLNLNAGTGAITGTPTGTGTSNFTVQVSDANAETGIKALSITVFVPPTITTASFPTAEENVAYNTAVAATGGTPSYTWAITVGSLPAGLTLNVNTGAITGSATSTGTSNFTVQVTDANSVTANKALSITVAGPTITTTSLPNGTQSTSYATTVVATGGTTPYTWSLSAGTLPAGLSLNTVSGAISGTPTATGTINFTVRVTDTNSATTTMALSITVNAPSIKFVQVANNLVTTSQTSISVNIATTAGHLLVAFVREGSNNTDTFAISDTGGNAWTQTTSGYVSAGSTHRAAMFYSFTTQADTSVTANFTGGAVSPTTITVMEFSGATAADGSVNSSSSSASSLTSGTLTPTQSTDVLIYAVGAGGTQTSWTAGSNFAIPSNNVATGANGSNARSGMQYRILIAPFSGTTSMSDSTSGSSMVGVFGAFR